MNRLLLFLIIVINSSQVFGSTSKADVGLSYHPQVHDTSGVTLRTNDGETNNISGKHQRRGPSFESADLGDYFETNYYLETGYSYIRLQMGLGNNLRLDRSAFKYRMIPVSIQYERALDYNFTGTVGIGGQLITQEETEVDYAYYNLFTGISYHFNLEPITDIDYLMPYVGISASYRAAFANGYEGDFREWSGRASVDFLIGIKYHYKLVGLLLEVGSSDTSCARLGLFFAIN